MAVGLAQGEDVQDMVQALLRAGADVGWRSLKVRQSLNSYVAY